jgi:hypothetical protein
MRTAPRQRRLEVSDERFEGNKYRELRGRYSA